MLKEQIVTKLVGRIENSESTFIVIEATGGYERLLVTRLHQHNSALAVVNPRRIRDFADGVGRDAKTDPIDAQVIAFYGQVVKPAAQAAKSEEEKKLQALVERRRPWLDVINQEHNRIPQTIDREIRGSIERVLSMAALVATRFNPRINAFYQRLPGKGKPKKVALTAALRKRHHDPQHVDEKR